ncbi:hypothetical protein G7Y89_g8413 [Cudoniella acicularis]|uniref:Zn(2)-C6 fungal-type domain-containing protein n=1 Tax=Cudoniella acicularis TaxID=354080 RepID=A0A8H4RIQ7_9HELO|nr:hypothetical protein G7Y89_g8413 [Cudoniella acicularis]
MDGKPTKRLRTSIACKKCRASKQRCEGGNPCSNCSHRGLQCEPERTPQHRAHSAQIGDNYEIQFDLPLVARAITTKLLDRYFAVIAPHWRIIEKEDLQQTPYVPPLLLRSICLLSAHLAGTAEKDLTENIAESIRQCFDAHEMLCLPTVSSFKSMILLLASPLFSQSSIMTASACRMALTLGLHRPQHPHPELYWSCIVAARWQALKRSQNGAVGRLCFDLEKTPPETEPDRNSFFGAIYHLLAAADPNHTAPENSIPHPIGTEMSPGYPFKFGNLIRGSTLEQNPTLYSLLDLLQKYLSGSLSEADTAIMDVQRSLAFELNPFNQLSRVSMLR